MKYIVLQDLKQCSKKELKQQKKYHKEPLEPWEKIRMDHINKLLKDESRK